MEHKHSPPSNSFEKDEISERMAGAQASRMTSLHARGEHGGFGWMPSGQIELSNKNYIPRLLYNDTLPPAAKGYGLSIKL
jgi:hypothetical protein